METWNYLSYVLQNKTDDRFPSFLNGFNTFLLIPLEIGIKDIYFFLMSAYKNETGPKITFSLVIKINLKNSIYTVFPLDIIQYLLRYHLKE